jgi:serine/threonine protein kinase
MTFSLSMMPESMTTQYHVLEQIGVGGHAAVFRATSRTDLSLRVAIKVLHAPVIDETRRRRFERECAALRRLNGAPHVVQLIDAGIENGRAYLVTPLFDGNYETRLESLGRIDPAEVARVGADIASALAAAHAAGIIHRDVKPSNVFIADDTLSLLGDFGAAGLVDAHTITGSVALSIAYAAPEVLELGEMSSASDLYALGVTLYHLLTGTLPFGGSATSLADAAGVGALVRRVTTEPPAPITVTDAPDGLIDLTMQLLDKDPQRRPVDATAVEVRLREMAHTAPAEKRERRPPNRVLMVGAAAIVAALVAVVTNALRSDSAPGDRSSTAEAEVPEVADPQTVLGESGATKPGGEEESVMERPIAVQVLTPSTDAPISVTTIEQLPERSACENDVTPICDDWENGISLWTDTSDPQFARIEPAGDVGGVAGTSLAMIPSDEQSAGSSSIERSFEIPADSMALYASFRLYVEPWGPDGFWTNLLTLRAENGRQWRVNLIAADASDVRVDMWTFPVGQWLCVEFAMTPNAEVAATLSIDDRPVALVPPLPPEPLGSTFSALLGSIYIDTPSRTPNVYFDDLLVSTQNSALC